MQFTVYKHLSTFKENCSFHFVIEFWKLIIQEKIVLATNFFLSNITYSPIFLIVVLDATINTSTPVITTRPLG